MPKTRAEIKATYRAKPGILEKEREQSRDYARRQRAGWSPDQLQEYQAAQRKYRASPEQAAKSRTRSKAWLARQLELGLCIACAQPASAGRYCETHWFGSIGNRAGLKLSDGGAELLRRIWDEQNGVCALTGERLVKGQNASLDHRTPRSKGGTNDRGNLRWVHKVANTIKKDMTDEEFVALCRRIVAHHDRSGDVV